MAKERKRLINEDMVQEQATTMPPRVGQSSRTPGRDNMGQEEVAGAASGVKRVTVEVNTARPDLLG